MKILNQIELQHHIIIETNYDSSLWRNFFWLIATCKWNFQKKLALKRRTCVGLSETLNLSEATCAERPIQWLEDSSLLTYTTSNCCLYSSKYYLKIPNKSHHFLQKFFKYSNFPAKTGKDCTGSLGKFYWLIFWHENSNICLALLAHWWKSNFLCDFETLGFFLILSLL